MAKLLPNVRAALRRASGIQDDTTRKAVEGLEAWAQELVAQLSKIDGTSVGGVVLPIAESDVTNLVTHLAGKAALSHTHAEADVTGLTADLAAKVPNSRTLTGTSPILIAGDNSAHDLSADRTISFDTAWLPNAPAGLFGSGECGALNFDGTNSVVIVDAVGATISTLTVSTVTIQGSASQKLYTLQSDVHATNVTIASGVWVATNGYRLFCTGTLTLNGHIGWWGNDGANSVNGTNTGGAGGAALSSTVMGGSSAGGTGGTAAGGLGGTGASTSAAPRGAVSGAASGTGGCLQGGKGGTRSDGTGGGNGGSVTRLADTTGPFFANIWQAITGRSMSGFIMSGGSGGGGGSGGTAAGGGGGGGGGGGAGNTAVVAFSITGSGEVNCVGGYGGNAATEADDTAGGGGGGSGGVAIVAIGKGSFPTVNVAGGLKGAASPNNSSTNKAGFNGGPGLSYTVRLGT